MDLKDFLETYGFKPDADGNLSVEPESKSLLQTIVDELQAFFGIQGMTFADSNRVAIPPGFDFSSA
jgi:hypothetical protein